MTSKVSATDRSLYLQQLLQRHQNITLPIASTNATIPLQTIFQPLTLLSDPLVLQKTDKKREQELLDSLLEETSEQQRITVNNGQEALAKSEQQRMVILGGPGMGKTTMLKDLLQQAIQRALQDELAPLPIFISLPDLARSGLKLQEYSAHSVAELKLEANFSEIIVSAIEDGQAFICLDSLDEVVPALRPDIITLINREALECGGTWIVGSRFTEYKGGQFAHSQFAEWELQPLDEKTQILLATQLLTTLQTLLQKEVSIPSSAAETFVQTLRRDTQTATWARTPLLLSLAAVVYVQTGRLPTRRAQLYAEAIDMMLRTRISEQVQRQQLHTVLAELSLQLYQSHGRNFTLQDLQLLLADLVTDETPAEQYAQLTQLLDSGVFETVAYQTYGFKHQTFQEYLCAVALAHRLCSSDEQVHQQSWEFIWSKHPYSRWNEILPLLVGVLTHDYGHAGVRITTQWLERLTAERETPDGDPGHLCLLLALSSLREFATEMNDPALVSLTSTLVEEWAKEKVANNQRTQSAYGRQLSSLERALAEVELTIAVPAIQLLKKHKIDWRIHTSSDTNHINMYLSHEILLAAFEDQPHIRLAECYQMQNWQDEQIVQRVLTLYAESHNHSLRQAILGLFSHIKSPLTVEPLILCLQSTTERYELRTLAAQALKNLGDLVPLTVFRSALQDKELSIRYIATLVVGLRDDYTRAVELVNEICQNTNDYLYYAAIEACAQRKIHPPIHALVKAINDNCKGDMVAAVIAIFEKYKETIPVEPFLILLKNTDDDIADLAAGALKILGERVEDTIWIEVIQHAPGEDVRETAAELLEKRKYAFSIEQLLHMLNEENTKPVALRILSTMRSQIPLKRLLDMLTEDHPIHNEATVLEWFADRVPTEPIITALHQLNVQQNPAACRALISLLLKQGVQPSQEILNTLLNQPAKSIHNQREYAELVTFLCKHKFKIELPIIIRATMQADNRQKNLMVANFQQFKPDDVITILLDGLYRSLNQYKPDTKAVYYSLAHIHTWVTPTLLRNKLSNTIQDQYFALRLLAAVKRLPEQFLSILIEDEKQDAGLKTQAILLCNEAGIKLSLQSIIAADIWFVADTSRGVSAEKTLTQAVLLLNEDRSAITPVLEHLKQTQSKFAVEVLKRLSPLVSDATIIELLTDTNPNTRRYAIQITGTLGARAPQQQLVEILHNTSENDLIREEVLKALAQLREYAPLEILLAMLSDEDDNIRAKTLAALRQLIAQSGREVPSAIIFRQLEDDNSLIVYEAIQLLETMLEQGQDLPTELLFNLLEKQNGSIKTIAARILCKIAEKTPLENLLSLIDSASYLTRMAIIAAIGYLKEQAPLEIILANLNVYSREALKVLSQTLPEKIVALPPDHPYPTVRESIQLALQTMLKKGNDISAYTHLTLAALDDQESTVKQGALKTMKDGSKYFTPDPLLKVLKEDNYKMQQGALQTLSTFGPRVPVEQLLPLLSEIGLSKDAMETLRCTHPEVLIELIPEAEAILRGEALTGVFAARTQYRIAQTVSKIGQATPEVMETVIALLAWPQWDVQEQAARALGSIKRNIPDHGIRALMNLRKNAVRTVVRVAADEALGEILSVEQGMEDE